MNKYIILIAVVLAISSCNRIPKDVVDRVDEAKSYTIERAKEATGNAIDSLDNTMGDLIDGSDTLTLFEKMFKFAKDNFEYEKNCHLPENTVVFGDIYYLVGEDDHMFNNLGDTFIIIEQTGQWAEYINNFNYQGHDLLIKFINNDNYRKLTDAVAIRKFKKARNCYHYTFI